MQTRKFILIESIKRIAPESNIISQNFRKQRHIFQKNLLLFPFALKERTMVDLIWLFNLNHSTEYFFDTYTYTFFFLFLLSTVCDSSWIVVTTNRIKWQYNFFFMGWVMWKKFILIKKKKMLFCMFNGIKLQWKHFSFWIEIF